MFLEILIVNACAVSSHVSVCAGDFSALVCVVCVCVCACVCACVCVRVSCMSGDSGVCVCVCECVQALRSLKCMAQCHVYLL